MLFRFARSQVIPIAASESSRPPRPLNAPPRALPECRGCGVEMRLQPSRLFEVLRIKVQRETLCIELPCVEVVPRPTNVPYLQLVKQGRKDGSSSDSRPFSRAEAVCCIV